MNVRRLLLVVPLLATAAVTPAAAHAQLTLNAYCAPGPVPQTWGDVPGRVNFSNRVLTGFGDGSVRTINLTGSGDGSSAGLFPPLPCAMYGAKDNGDRGDPTDVGEIGIIPDGTSNTILLGEVTFGFRDGADPTVPRDAQIRVYEGDCAAGPTLRSSRNVTIQDGTSNTIVLGETLTGPGCLQWNDPWFAGLGQLTVTALPEPATVALTAVGLGALVPVVRRRRA
jgi:hypothetical protein